MEYVYYKKVFIKLYLLTINYYFEIYFLAFFIILVLEI